MEAWSVYVELAATDTLDSAIDALHDALAEHDAAIGTAPNGNLSAQLSIKAGTARKAIQAALTAVTSAAAALGITTTVMGIELMTEEELDRRLAAPAVPDLVGISEIAGMLDVVRQRATQLAKRDGFPPAVAHLRSGPVYVREQVEAWAARWDRSVGRPPGPVELTSLEEQLVELISHIHSAAPRRTTGADASLKQLLAKVSLRVKGHADLDWRKGMLLFLGPDGETEAALRSLRAARLIDVHADTAEDGTREFGVELTTRGEKLVSA